MGHSEPTAEQKRLELAALLHAVDTQIAEVRSLIQQIERLPANAAPRATLPSLRKTVMALNEERQGLLDRPEWTER